MGPQPQLDPQQQRASLDSWGLELAEPLQPQLSAWHGLQEQLDRVSLALDMVLPLELAGPKTGFRRLHPRGRTGAPSLTEFLSG